MKKILVWLTLFALISCTFCGCGKSESAITFENCKEVLRVEDYGIIADSFENAKANTKALNKLIKSAKEGMAICFSKGKYYFDSTDTCIQINNKNSLMLYGEDALLINTSFDPTKEITDKTYHHSMMISLNNSSNIRIEGLTFDYYRYTQVCGKIVERYPGVTAIKLAPAFISGEDKPPITGNEIVSAVNVLDKNGAAIGEIYADKKYNCYLFNNKFYVMADFGNVGEEAVARFSISTAPEFYAQETKMLTVDNVKSYSSPAAVFLMSGNGNSDFNFNSVTVAPPENAVWKWGSNVDGIFLNCMRGKANITNCTFIGMGDDALNIHSTAAKVKSVNGNKVNLVYAYNNALINRHWVQKGDELVFYKNDFTVSARAKVKKCTLSTVTLEITDGAVSVDDIVENASLSPKVKVENVTVDGGRARAFLLQTDNVEIKNCNISNLGLAGIIISPDINKWYEMGPAENVTISGCTFDNICTMGGDNCKGAIFSASSHDGHETKEIIHKNIVITENTFLNIKVPAINLTSADGVKIKDNTYNSCPLPIVNNCKNVTNE